jgi:hypothetical protein
VTGWVVRYARQADGFSAGQAVLVGSDPVDVTSLAYRAETIVAGLRPNNAAAPARVFVWPLAGGGQPSYFESDYVELPAVALLGEDAGYVIVAGRDSAEGPVTLQVWDTATRVRVGRALGGLSGDVTALGGNETQAFAADASGAAYRWRLDGDPTHDICNIVGRPLTRDEWETLAGGVLKRYDPTDVCASSAVESAAVVSAAVVSAAVVSAAVVSTAG